MSAPGVTALRGGTGYFQVVVTHPDGRHIDVSFFRGAPTRVDSFSSADPFGDSTASISFDAITSFDTPGTGDLFWLVPWALVTIFWWDIVDGLPVKNRSWVWEGFMVSEELTSPYQIQCKGALYIYDNYLAAPFYPTLPVPYELLMERLFASRPGRTGKFLVRWPADWQLRVPHQNPADPGYLWFLQPWSVKPGQIWSGLTTRNTGGWEQVLTGFIQSLLSTMYTPTGDQWTIMKEYGRRPVLQVRQAQRFVDASTPVVYNGAPGVVADMSRDFTQSANVIYGSGKDLSGVSYSGAQVSPDGQTTWYEPFAALPQVYPALPSNPNLLTSIVRKELRIGNTSDAMDEISMREMAATQIRRLADPGYTGTITLQSDPVVAGEPTNRFLIQAGTPILVKNLRGFDVLFHITQTSVSPEDGSVTLTVDTKFRDALTVQEVRARTRDALDPVNLLKVGALSVTVNDMLKPWSYAEGSGMVPPGAKPLFDSMPQTLAFPWTEWTRKFPPKKRPEYYVKVSNKGPRANDRWQDYNYDKTQTTPNAQSVPIKGAANASIRLTQIAAYDRDGNQVPVQFHCGFWSNIGTSVDSMPMIPANTPNLPHGYLPAQRYPFFPGAFEAMQPTGEQYSQPGVMPSGDTTAYALWGSLIEPAGYSPGLKTSLAPKTGQLVDEEAWPMDTTGENQLNPVSIKDNMTNKTAGQIYFMVFCDDLDEVYFLGRLFAVEPLPSGS